MPARVDRRTVDLSGYPDLVVIYLGMRVRTLPGLKTLLGLGPQIEKAGAARPEGLLHYENNIIFSLFPLHLGMRWYWKDFDSMERWARSEPHRIWWQNFLRNSGGTGFWHETYFRDGQVESIYIDMPPVGFCQVRHSETGTWLDVPHADVSVSAEMRNCHRVFRRIRCIDPDPPV